MDITAVFLLLLEQGDHSLKDQTRDFLDLAHLIQYPDRSLYVFYKTGLNKHLKSHLPMEGPQGSFAICGVGAGKVWFSVHCLHCG